MTTIAIQHHYGEDPLCKCDDCGQICWFSQLDAIVDIQERLMAGCETPAGDCRKCGALAYILNDENAECRRFKVKLKEFIAND